MFYNSIITSMSIYDSKNDRMDYGDIAEKLAYEAFLDKNIEVEWLRVGINQKSPFDNMREGDLYLINTDEYIDVKGTTFVSYNSAKNFEGDFFLFIPNMKLSNAWVAPAQSIQKYIFKVKQSGNLVPGLSRDLGWYFKQRTNISISLRDFMRGRID